MTVVAAHVRRARVPVLVLTTAILLTPFVTDTPAEGLQPGVEVVYVADGAGFADALVGAALAAANNTSVLTVAGTRNGDVVPQATKDELTRLKPKSIVILGGTGTVSDAVEAELGTYTDPPGNTSRLKGGDRYATAAAISQAIPDAVKKALFADEAGNTELLDGLDASAFTRRYWVAVEANGTKLAAEPAGSAFREQEGVYTVGVSDLDVRDCAYFASIARSGDDLNPLPGIVTANKATQYVNTVEVRTYDVSGALSDRPFHLVVVC